MTYTQTLPSGFISPDFLERPAPVPVPVLDPDPARRLGLARRSLPQFTWGLANALLRSAYRVEVTGRRWIPRNGSCIFVANHTSHLDIFTLTSQLPRSRRKSAVPMAAADFFFANRILGTLTRGFLNAVPIRRDAGHRHELADLRQELVQNTWSYVLFPEGTRSRTGQMGSFRAGVGALVAETSVPVIPCHISGAHAIWPPNKKLPRLRGKLSLRFGAPLRFPDVPNQRSGWDQVAGELEEAVGSLGEGRTYGRKKAGSTRQKKVDMQPVVRKRVFENPP